MSDLTPEQQVVLAEIDSGHALCIPSRKSPDMTPELWGKYMVLKELVYKGKIRFDVDYKNQCLVFYTSLRANVGALVYPDGILEAETIE